jgi:hypothetical protein
MTASELRSWASEHLMYEVDSLVYATVELGKTPEGRIENALLESFAVHARCLNDFLWHDRRKSKPRDAFAADFCRPGAWEKTRDALPQDALGEVRRRRRFGREVMHLTYDRIDGDGEAYGEEKEWPCGVVLLELATALGAFAKLALGDRLDDQTRATLSGLLVKEEPARLAFNWVTGATGIRLGQIRQITGGTINVEDVWAGGVGS